MNVEAGIQFLAEGGLNLFAVFDCATLPKNISHMLESSGAPVSAYRRLVMTGHGGRRLWQALQAWGMKTDDPVDNYSLALTKQFIHDFLADAPVFWLYPNTPYLAPLQQLGELAGWSYPSPLGSGISPIFGVWFAYRTLFLTNANLPVSRLTPAPSPCTSCSKKPCITSCPARAVQRNKFDLDACAHQRLHHSSSCEDRCLARMACPFFPEHQYTLPQIQYHYRISLKTLKAWYTTT